MKDSLLFTILAAQQSSLLVNDLLSSIITNQGQDFFGFTSSTFTWNPCNFKFITIETWFRAIFPSNIKMEVHTKLFVYNWCMLVNIWYKCCTTRFSNQMLQVNKLYNLLSSMLEL